MRSVHFSDLRAVAQAVRAAAPDKREALCEVIFRQAEAADRYVKKLGRLHPLWGNGTLGDSAAKFGKAPESSLDDPDFCVCMMTVLKHLERRPRSAHL